MITQPTSPRETRRFGAGALIAVGLLSAAVAGVTVAVATRVGTGVASSDEVAAGADETYRCPMHPAIVQDRPGTCPICGMKLMRSHDGEGAAAVPEDQEKDQPPPVPGMATVEIDPARQQLIGLKTTEATVGPVGGTWRTVGRVAVDETRVRHANIKIPGFVERVYVDFVGKKVNRGDALFSIYSPELLAAQEEYLLALRTRDAFGRAGGAMATDGDALVAAARRKLALWDVPEADIERIARTGEPTKTLTLRSPVSGVVTKKDVVEGMKLDAGAMPYEIVDLSSVWVLADVYESELSQVAVGMKATLTLNAFPNRVFEGRAVFIDPLLNAETRTVKLRLTFANPTGELRPEMFGEVVLQGASREALRIPTDAVIDSGTQKVVFVALAEGKFQPRRVKLGVGDAGLVEVVEGLGPGDRVVTGANFLVDSESRLRASLAEMAEGANQPVPRPSGTPESAPPHTGHQGH